ncbi:MAG: hypothetical protein U0992_11485 [Planctomycetaceae bacterium]
MLTARTEGAGWKVSAVHRIGNVDWTVESQQPFVVWRQPGQPQGRMDLITRVFDGAAGAQIGTEDVYDSAYGNNTIVTILKSTPLPASSPRSPRSPTCVTFTSTSRRRVRRRNKTTEVCSGG